MLRTVNDKPTNKTCRLGKSLKRKKTSNHPTSLGHMNTITQLYILRIARSGFGGTNLARAVAEHGNLFG